MPEHTVKRYDEELNQMTDTIHRMGGMVEQQLANAITALIKRDPELAATVIADDQPVDQLGVPQRQDHGDLAAHRVPDQVHRPVACEPVGQVLRDPVGGVGVREGLAPLRAAVVGQVDQGRAQLGLQRLRDLGEVASLPEEAVEEHHALAGVPDLGRVQGGCGGHLDSLGMARSGHARRPARADLVPDRRVDRRSPANRPMGSLPS